MAINRATASFLSLRVCSFVRVCVCHRSCLSPPCKKDTADVLSQRTAFSQLSLGGTLTGLSTSLGHNYIGYNYVGYNYIGLNCVDHKCVGHNRIDHDCIGLSTSLAPYGNGIAGYEGKRALWANPITIPTKVKSIELAEPPFEPKTVVEMKTTFRVKVKVYSGSVPLDAKLIQIELVAKKSDANAYFSDNVLARTNQKGDAEFAVSLESGHDGLYAFRSVTAHKIA